MGVKSYPRSTLDIAFFIYKKTLKTLLTNIILCAPKIKKLLYLKGWGKMKIIKRNGEEAIFDVQKIINAIEKANAAV